MDRDILRDARHADMQVKLGHDCEGKHKFDSMVDARAIAKASRRRKGGNVHPYRCRTCHGFHIGSLTTGQMRRPRMPAEDEEAYA